MSKKIIAGVGIVAALGVAVLPAAGSNAVNTVIKARVGEFVGCTSDGDTTSSTVNLGNISAGQQGTARFTIAGATNNPNGFKITAETIPTLVNSDYNTETIAYSASALSAGTEGWFLAAADGSTAGATIGAGIELNTATLTGDAKRDNSWDLDVTVSTAKTTTLGEYTGTIVWTCVAN